MPPKPTYMELEKRIAELEAICHRSTWPEAVFSSPDQAQEESYHQLLQSVLEAVPDLLIVIDREYKIRYSNFKGHDLIVPLEGDLRQTCYGRFKRLNAPCEDCSAASVFREGKSAEREMINPADGRIREVRAFPIFDAYGEVNRVVEYVRDITDSKRMEEAFHKTQRMEAIGTLASGIAHDFNNLLMGIQGHTSLLSIDLPPSHPHAEHLGAIEEHIQSAVNLTGQLLGVAQGGKYEVKPFDLNDLLETSASMFGRANKNFTIRMDLSSEPLVVEADRRQIEQVLLNIYVNASQAMPDGGDFHIKSRPLLLETETSLSRQLKPGRYVKISLTDTGTGMTEEVRKKVFDPFFTTKKKDRGTGLGLASAHGIVKNHGGMITVQSKEGHGSTFDIYLPHCSRAPEPHPQTSNELVGGRETVLLVDDETMIVDVAKAMLKRLGYRVVTASSGEEAVNRVAETGDDIDLVILDLIMPGIDGGKTFDLIHELQPALPVILSSGYSLDGQAADIMARGCQAFIQKPFDLQTLAQKAREVLAADRPVR